MQEPVIYIGYSLLNMAAGHGIVQTRLNVKFHDQPGPIQAAGNRAKVVHVEEYRSLRKKQAPKSRDFDLDGDETLLDLRERMRLLSAFYPPKKETDKPLDSAVAN